MAKKQPRAAASYRGARRNAVLRGKPKGMWSGVGKGQPYLGLSRLNRSRHWRYAKTYAKARELSPYPERAVR